MNSVGMQKPAQRKKVHFAQWRIFPFYFGWAIVAAAFAERVTSMGVYNNMGVFFKPVAADFGWSRAQTAAAFSLASLVIGGLSPFWGAKADKYGPRLFVMLEALSLAAGYILISRMNSLWQFYLFFVLFVGLGQSAGTSTILSTLPRWFEAKRGMVQGIVQSGAGLGIALAPIPLTYLIVTHSWRLAFIVSGITIGVTVLMVAWVYRRSPQDVGLLPDGKTTATTETNKELGERFAAAKAAVPPEAALSLRQALKTKNLKKLLVVATFAGFAHLVIATHLVPYATDIGFSPAVAASFMAVIGLANGLSKIIIGTASDRVGRKTALVFCFGLAAATYILLLTARQSWALYVFAAGFGFAYGGWLPLFPAIGADLFGVRSLGAIYGIINAATSIGAALGSFLGGYIFDVMQSYIYAFLLGEVLLIGGACLLLTLETPRKQGQQT